jgi:hypothetical protein
MRAETIVQFDKGLSKGLSTFSDNVRMVNWYNIPTPGARSTHQLVSIPGGEELAAMSPAAGVGCRGLWAASTGPESTGFLSTVYGVFGNTLFRYSKNGTKTAIGTLSSSTRAVSFAENQDQTLTQTRGFVCDGTSIYEWDLKAENANVATTFAEVSAIPFVNGSLTEKAICQYITYNTFRLILTAANSVQWYYSGINESDFANDAFESSESNPDKTVRVVSHGGNLWVLGAYSYDIFSYTGSATDPFDVGRGASGKIGCASGDSVAVHGDLLFWLGQGDNSNGCAYMADVAGTIRKITDPGIENVIRKWEYTETVQGFAFTERGNTFYAITSKFDNETLVFCVETGEWHTRSTSANGIPAYWDVNFVVNGYDGEVYYSSVSTNKLCKFVDNSGVDHLSYPITKIWQSPVYIANTDLFRLIQLTLDVETGIAPGEQQLYIQLSWDGGKVWGERIYRTLGKIGQYGKSVTVYGGGAGRNLVVRIGSSANLQFILYQMRMIIDKAGRT